MKRSLIITLVLSAVSSLTQAQNRWYGSNDFGISIQNVTLTMPDIVIDTVHETTTITGYHKEQTKLINFMLGLKVGYEYCHFVGEVNAHLNIDLTGNISLMTGYKIGDFYNDDSKHLGLSFTPLIGTDLNKFNYAGRLQYDHFILEASKMGDYRFFGIGFKCWLSE